MTRINVIEPRDLIDQHLLAELRELPRVWHYARPGRPGIPETYRLGKGHVLFFADKTSYLSRRHHSLACEAESRGFRVRRDSLLPVNGMDGLWDPTAAAIGLNLARLDDRCRDMKREPRHRGKAVGRDWYRLAKHLRRIDLDADTPARGSTGEAG